MGENEPKPRVNAREREPELRHLLPSVDVQESEREGGGSDQWGSHGRWLVDMEG